MQRLHLFRWTTSASTRLTYLRKKWHNETIQKRVLVGRRFCGHGRFCFGRDPDASQCGCFGEMVGNMKELGQGTSSEGLDIGSPYTARHMAEMIADQIFDQHVIFHGSTWPSKSDEHATGDG